MDEHKNHDTVSAAAQRTENQKQMTEMQKTFQQRIQQREKDLKKLREAVESHKCSAQTAVEDSERIFTDLICYIERSRSELIQMIRDQEKAALSRAEGRLERLKQEINDLRRRDTELEQLSHERDHIQFLQNFQSFSLPPESTEVNDNSFSSLFSSDGLRESVLQLRDKLEDFCKEELMKISDRVTFTNIVSRTRNDFLKYSHQLNLDLNTVNKYIRLSVNNRVIAHTYTEQSYPDHPDRFVMYHSHQLTPDLNTVNKHIRLSVNNRVIAYINTAQSYPDHPDRFDVYRQVLCRESVCGRCYWELEWSGNNGVRIAVSYKSISRKGKGKECRFGANDQSWSLICSPSRYSFWHNKIQSSLPVKSINSRIGVTENQQQLKETQKTFQQKIQQREKGQQQLREAVESHKRSAQTAVEDSERIFTELTLSLTEKSCSELIRLIRDQEKAALSRAEGRLERLKQEINDLRRTDSELEQLSHTQDHIQFLQTFQSFSLPPESTEVNDNSFSSLFSSDGLRESALQLRDKLEDFCKEELKKISDRVTFTNIVPRTRNNFLQYSHQLTPDLNTLNKYIRLSESNRMTAVHTVQSYPDHPDRFDVYRQVLCRESVCGRCYWELEWSGNNGVRIAMSYKSISRKGEGKECLFGCNDQSWSLFCSPSRYSFWHSKIRTALPVKSISRKIGVYVDHSAGTLSFYSVSDTMSLIHTVQTTFTQPLYPGFGFGSGSS
ncbi:hypothetical protein QQF64_018855, partial [Cirrhinus molitorella]